MKELLSSILLVSLVSYFFRLLIPQSSSRMHGTVTFALSLVTCFALLSPLFSLTRGEITLFPEDLPTVESTVDGKEALLASLSESLCEELEKEVEEAFSLVAPDLSLSFDVSDWKAVLLTEGTLTGEGDLKAAALYLSERLGCPITPLYPKEN